VYAISVDRFDYEETTITSLLFHNEIPSCVNRKGLVFKTIVAVHRAIVQRGDDRVR
jgi:hypothetical protein